MKITNPNRYESNFAKKVEIKIELMLDSVPGAWHKPEDFMKWVCGNNYVQTVELVEKIDMEPATVDDLKELLKFAFAAGLGKHPNELTPDELKRWREFEPVPRSIFQRVEHAVRMQEKSKGV